MNNLHGTGLVEVLWKTVTRILNFYLIEAIKFHNTLHGFCTGRGKGATLLKSKLLHQLTEMR